MRYAVYFTPGEHHPLTHAAANWLGRDPFSGAALSRPLLPTLSQSELAARTVSASRYGFHATLKAPFRLAAGMTEAALEDALDVFAGLTPPVELGRLEPVRIDGFMALMPAGPADELNRLAGDIVRVFDRFRAPLTEADIKRRNPDALSVLEAENRPQWGYPYVFESFRFHMTLTDRVAEPDVTRVRAAIDEHFGAILQGPVTLDGMALFVEPQPGTPFTVKSWHGLRGRQGQGTA